MLCPRGRELKQVFDAEVRNLTDAEKAMADSAISFLVRDQRFQKAQTNRKSAANAFLEHKANCSTCRARDSAIRPRFSSTS
jgi:hypothetical protein